MGVGEGNLQVIDIDVIDIDVVLGVIMEKCRIIFLYGTYLPVTIMVFVIHTISYIYDSMCKIEDKYR